MICYVSGFATPRFSGSCVKPSPVRRSLRAVCSIWTAVTCVFVAAQMIRVRGYPKRGASRDYWPARETSTCPAAVFTVAEPRAKPSDVLSAEVVLEDPELVPHARKPDFTRPVMSPPQLSL